MKQLVNFGLSLFAFLAIGLNLQAQNEIAVFSGRQTSAATTVANASATPLSQGVGLTASGTSTFNSRAWSLDSTSVNDAIANDEYIEWTVSAVIGYTVFISEMEIDYDRSNTGPKRIAIRTSLDGYASDIYVDSTVSESGEVVVIDSLNLISAPGGSITFRLYGYHATTSSGTFDIESDDLGTVLGQADAGILVRGAVFVNCTPPTVQASSVSASSITTTSMDLNWTRGNGDSVMVIAKQRGTNFFGPFNGIRLGADAVYGNGASVGDGFVVYKGTGTSVSLSSLAVGTPYEFQVLEYFGADPCYVNGGTVAYARTLCLQAEDPNNFAGSPNTLVTTLTWNSSDCMDGVIVVGSLAQVAGTPSGTFASYTDNSVFGLGGLLNPGEFVVYSGVDSSVTVTGLTNLTPYNYKVFSSKGATWSPGKATQVTPDVPATYGDIWITEIMVNPNEVADRHGEWFEVYNNTDSPINLQGWTIAGRKVDGEHVINKEVIVPAYDFAVLSALENSANNGGVPSNYQYQYSRIKINNGPDTLRLTNNIGVPMDTVAWDNGTNFPYEPGKSLVYTGTNQNQNSDISLWKLSDKREGYTAAGADLGSPGMAGSYQYINWLVFENGYWSQEPDATTGARNAIVKRDEDGSLFYATTSVNRLVVEPGATLDIGSNNNMQIGDTAFFMADTISGYSMVRGDFVGHSEYWIIFESDLTARWFNAAIPIEGDLADVKLSSGSFRSLAESTGGMDSNQVNVWNFEPTILDTYTSEGSWTPIQALTEDSHEVGYSIFLGAPYFGTLPIIGKARGDLANGSISMPISQANGGYNFVPNPYPSTLNWNSLILDNPLLNKTYYTFNDDSDSVYVGYNSLSGGINIPGTVVGGTRYLAPTQGFFINAGTATTLEFENDQRTVTQSPRVYKTAGSEGIFLVVENKTTNKSDYLYVGFQPGANDGYQTILDGRKKMNTARKTPNFYSELLGENYMYKFVNDQFASKSIPLTFTSRMSASFEISSLLKYIDPAWTVVLEDVSNNTFTNIKNNNYSFNFQKTASNVTHHFVLHINTNGVGIDELTKSDMYWHKTTSGIAVNTGASPIKGGELLVHDISGKVLHKINIGEAQEVEVNMEKYSHAVYFISIVQSGATVYRNKVTW